MTCRHLFIFLLFLYTAPSVFGFRDADTVLLRTKRLSDEDDDYITTFQSNQLQEYHVKSPVRKERHINEEHSIAEDELSNVFRNIVQKRDLRNVEDFHNLKEFFDDIRKSEHQKRSDTEIRYSHSNVFTDSELDRDVNIAHEIRRSLEAVSSGDVEMINNRDESGSSSGVVEFGEKDGDTSESGGESDVLEHKKREVVVGGDGETEEDYNSLFTKIVQRRSVENVSDKEEDTSGDDVNDKQKFDEGDKEKHVVKRNTEYDDEEDFKGLPEALAVKDISRRNPRATILKREARHTADIPLPFNLKKNETDINLHETVIQNSSTIHMMKKSIVSPLTDIEAATGANYSKTNDYPDSQARSVRDTKGDEGVQKIRKIRSTSSSVSDEKRNSLYTKTVPVKELKSLDIVKRALEDDEFNRLKFIDDEKADSLFDGEEENFLSGIDNNGVYYDTRHKRFLITADASSVQIANKTERAKRSIINDTEPNLGTNNNIVNNTFDNNNIHSNSRNNDSSNIHSNSRNNDISNNNSSSNNDNSEKSTDKTIKIKKREIYYDDDPDIERKMNKIDQDKMNRALAAFKQAKSVYRFARDVVDIVDEKRPEKAGQQVSALQGVWAGLGTSPEFVPGLIKRSYNDNKKEESMPGHHKTRKISKEELVAIREKRRINDESTVKKLYDSVQKNVVEDPSNENVGVTNSYETQQSSDIGTKSNVETSLVKSNTAEIGSLGSVNQVNSITSNAKVGNLGSVNFHAYKRDQIDSTDTINVEKSKRQDHESEIDINHMTSPTNDGKVVFAFDEIKELVPAKTFQSQDEETQLEPLQSHENSAAVMSTYDVDKDLAEGMVVSKDNVPPRPLSSNLLATYVEYTKNDPTKRSKSEKENEDDDKTKKSETSLLRKEGKLGQAQLAQYKMEQAGPRFEQMKKWAGQTLSKPPYEGTVEVSDRTAETDAELQKLNLASLNLSSYEPYKNKDGETDSEYLAKTLREKNEQKQQTKESHDIDNLHEKIIEEQGRYKVYLEQLRKEQQIQQQSKTDDFETQTKPSKNLGKQVNTTAATISTTATISTIGTSTPSPTIEQEGALEHFERVHGYDKLSETTVAPQFEAKQQSSTTTVSSTVNATKEKNVASKNNTNAPTNNQSPTNLTENITIPTTISPSTLDTIVHTTTLIPTMASQQITAGLPISYINFSVSTTEYPASNKWNQPIIIPVIESTNVINKSNNPPQTQGDSQHIQPQNSSSYPTQTINNATSQNVPLTRTFDSNGQQLTTPNNQSAVLEAAEVSNGFPTKYTSLFPMDIAYQPRPMPPKNTTSKHVELVIGIDGYIGCFIDRLEEGRDLPVRAGLPYVTPNNCRTICKKTGYRYAGMQYGYLCFCGNMYGKYDNVPDNECNTVCSGNDRFTCGGLWRNKIYDTENVEEVDLSTTRQYQDAPGTTRSFIPYAPPSDLRENLNYAERQDFDSLQDEVKDAMSHAETDQHEMRDIQNMTDDNWLQFAQDKVFQNPQAAEKTQTIQDVQQQGQQDNDGSKFIYMHAQENERVLKQSPERQVVLIPGTHLYRCEIKLAQLWYDDFTNPASTKYRILTGNVENAVKNLFMNDKNFFNTQVVALKESDPQMPHRTVVEFTVIFKDNGTSGEDFITHRIFESVKQSKKLDDMPVLPNTLKVREYLSTNNLQKYINKIQDTTTSRFKHDSITRPDDTGVPPSTIRNTIASDLNHVTDNIQSSPYHVVRTQVKPVEVSNGMTELRNYIASQTNVGRTVNERRSSIKQPQSKRDEGLNGDDNKPPYLLRMFFWKDMLARKKRDLEEEEEATADDSLENKITDQIKAKSIISSLLVKASSSNEVPIIRSKRSQADDQWPISYKGDAMKKSYKNKRKIDNKFHFTNEKEEGYSKLLGEKENNVRRVRRSKIFKKLTAILDDNVVEIKKQSGQKSLEGILYRTKRTEE